MLTGLKPALYADSARKAIPHKAADKNHNENENT
jgi:hypothetical protein